MRKKLLIISVFIFLTSLPVLKAADIKGRVLLSPKGEPYTHGAILLQPLGGENRIKASIDPEGHKCLRRNGHSERRISQS